MKISRFDGGRTLKVVETGQVLGRKNIGALIRAEDVEILVTDESGIDWTQETLFEIAFHDQIPYKYAKDLAEFLPEDKLYDIICAGGISNYKLRQRL